MSDEMTAVGYAPGSSMVVRLVETERRDSLRDRIGHSSSLECAALEAPHAGTGTLEMGTLLDNGALEANLAYLHRGRLMPKGGIGHHFHMAIEEMYVILNGEAEFTVDGRTALLRAPVAAPCRLGHSHGIYNRTQEPIEWMNVGVTLRKNVLDTFDLGDDRVAAVLDPIPPFITVRLDTLTCNATSPAVIRRMLAPGVFAGPLSYVDHAAISAQHSCKVAFEPHHEGVVFVLRGSAVLAMAGKVVDFKEGDALPVRNGESAHITNTGVEDLNILLVGISL